jgi:hypothetical protein
MILAGMAGYWLWFVVSLKYSLRGPALCDSGVLFLSDALSQRLPLQVPRAYYSLDEIVAQVSQRAGLIGLGGTHLNSPDLMPRQLS